jgi:hypothetical protein
VFEFGILTGNQTIWPLARCGVVKQFEKLIEFSLWGPYTGGVAIFSENPTVVIS